VQLTPPISSVDGWAEAAIYTFSGGADGSSPSEVIDHSGLLYGYTGDGGAANCGTVFSLAPRALSGRTWTKTIFYLFMCNGFPPVGNLAPDGQEKL
jgi:uncharacterized repeat protein (TIGR03803 family)